MLRNETSMFTEAIETREWVKTMAHTEEERIGKETFLKVCPSLVLP
jgi:hypothetical protein